MDETLWFDGAAVVDNGRRLIATSWHRGRYRLVDVDLATGARQVIIEAPRISRRYPPPSHCIPDHSVAFGSSQDGRIVVASLDGSVYVCRRTGGKRWAIGDKQELGSVYSVSPLGMWCWLRSRDTNSVFRILHDQLRVVPGLQFETHIATVGRVEHDDLLRHATLWWHANDDFVIASVDVADDVETVTSVVGAAHSYPEPVRYSFAGGTNSRSRLCKIDLRPADDLSFTYLPAAPPDCEYLVSAGVGRHRVRAAWISRDLRALRVFELSNRGWKLEFEDNRATVIDITAKCIALSTPEPIWALAGASGTILRVGSSTKWVEGFYAISVLGTTDKAVLLSGHLDDSAFHALILVAEDGAVHQLTDPTVHARAVCSKETAVVDAQSLDSATLYSTALRPGQRRSTLQVERFRTVNVTVQQYQFGTVALFRPSAWSGDELPLVLDVYGGPYVSRTRACVRDLARMQHLADAGGFAVATYDGRYAPQMVRQRMRRTHSLLTSVVDDAEQALDVVLRRHREIAPDRVAVRGWSFGGYTALACANRIADQLTGVVAGSPVTDWRWYDTHYTERLLGCPLQNEAAYHAASLLDGGAPPGVPTQIFHGDQDANVLPAHSLAYREMYSALAPDLLVTIIPGLSHTRDGAIYSEVYLAEVTHLRGLLMERD